MKTSLYEDQLVWALSRPRLSFGQRYLVASALQAYVRAKTRHLAEPGQRVRLHVEVELAARDPVPGRYGDAYLHRLRDGFGRLLVWYATGKRLRRGNRYELHGTVRAHRRFGPEPATVVYRCRVVPATR